MTLGANGVANKLFLTFLFSDPDVSVIFLKDVGQNWSSMVCYKRRSQLSWCCDTNRKDGYRWQCQIITLFLRASLPRQLGTVRGFSREFNVGFVSYVRRRSLIRTRSKACGGIPQPLQPDESLHISPGLLHVCGGVPIRQRGPFHQVHRHRCNHRSSVATVDWSATPVHHRGHVAISLRRPTPHFRQSLITTRRFALCISPRMTCCSARICG